MEQFTTRGIIKNNRTIGWQLVEPNSCVWSVWQSKNPWLQGLHTCLRVHPLRATLESTHSQGNSHASLNGGNSFWEMHCLVILWLYENHKVYFNKPRWYSLVLLGYKPVQHITILNSPLWPWQAFLDLNMENVWWKCSIKDKKYTLTINRAGRTRSCSGWVSGKWQVNVLT